MDTTDHTFNAPYLEYDEVKEYTKEELYEQAMQEIDNSDIWNYVSELQLKINEKNKAIDFLTETLAEKHTFYRNQLTKIRKI